MAFFSIQLIRWYNKNKRVLPWRETSDPYKIWVSEIILQQTRIDQGTDYYLRFIKVFPNVGSLAKAHLNEVLKLWQGLGYYSRARNLHSSAKEIVQKHNGTIPDTYDRLIKLKGIGDYTAGAILSIAYNKTYPVVDGNVIRVVSRVFGITESSDDAAVIKQIRSIADANMPKKQAGTYNQALMEFGALQCKPQNPDCASCCLKSICIAFKKNIVGMLPVKKASVIANNRYLNYFLINCIIKSNHFLYIRKRTDDDIWKNLYDLPCIETRKESSFAGLIKFKEWKNIFGLNDPVLQNTPSKYIHKLSHQIIHAAFYNVTISLPLKKSESFREIKASQLNKFPVPRLIENYLVSQKLLKQNKYSR